MKVLLVVVCSFIVLTNTVDAKSEGTVKEKPAWAKKDIRDYSEADMERLLDQWVDNDEDGLPDEPDELPEHKRPWKMDPTKMDMSDPEKLLRTAKKGRTVMMFVNVASTDYYKTDSITAVWQSSLQNNHLVAQRFLLDETRALFMFADGEHAWESKDFLVQQELCISVSIDGQSYDGPAALKEAQATEEAADADASKAQADPSVKTEL